MSILRTDIAGAIMKGLDESPHEECKNYDPDCIYRAADEVVAMLMSRLSGQRFETKFHPHIVGPAEITSDGVLYD